MITSYFQLHRFSSCVAVLFVAILVAHTHAQTTASITPSARAASASEVSQVIPADYAGFGIEPSNLFSFTGGQDNNELTIQLMQNIRDYAGKSGHLRIGGNTQDYLLYDDSMLDFVVKDNPDPVGQGAVPSDVYLIGPRYFEAINRFPNDTPITFGLNMAYFQADYPDRIASMAQAAVSKLTNVDLVSFEIGNEPDLYLDNLFRNGTWNGQTYVQEWIARAQAVYTRVLQPAGQPVNFFEGPCAASTIGTTFEISLLVNDGIQAAANLDGTANLPYIRSWNQHDYFYYIGVTPGEITVSVLMDLDNTESQYAYWATQVGIALQTGLPYSLREMASVGPVGLAGVSDTFGAALWTLNFFLYAATLNISSVQMHMTDNSFASPWQPTDSNGIAKYVRPNYYAFAAMAQLIGSGNGTTQVAKLPNDNVPGAYKSNVRMYAGYGQGGLTSVTIINSMQANASQTSKGSLAVSLSLGGFEGQTLYLSYLTADGADSTNGTVWNGLQYSNNDGTPSTTGEPVQNITIGDDGIAIVNIRDSQALIAYIGSQLGSNEVVINGTVPTGTSGGSPTTSASVSTTNTAAAATSSKSSASTALRQGFIGVLVIFSISAYANLC